jgi:hypothetical protein
MKTTQMTQVCSELPSRPTHWLSNDKVQQCSFSFLQSTVEKPTLEHLPEHKPAEVVAEPENSGERKPSSTAATFAYVHFIHCSQRHVSYMPLHLLSL